MKQLFKHHENDNVAIALDDFREGDKAVLIDEHSKQIGEIVLQAGCKRYFKLTIEEIQSGEPFIKLGASIGIAHANFKLLPGLPVHDCNFTVDDYLISLWDGNIAKALTAIFNNEKETGFAPYVFAKATEDLKGQIALKNVQIPKLLKNIFFAGIDVSDDLIIGRTLRDQLIPKNTSLRLGVCVDKEPFEKLNAKNIDTFRRFNRMIKEIVK